MNTPSSTNTILNLALFFAGTASIGVGGITRLPPIPANTYMIEDYASPLTYNTLFNNVMFLNSLEENEPIIPMETIKKLKIKVMKSEELRILPC